MSLNIDIEEWKKGIPQRELEQKIREYEEDYPKREKMTPQARENNQIRFFLEDRFYELHKQQLADMLKKQAEENGKVCFREGYPGIVPSMNSYSDGSNVGYTPLPASPTLGEVRWGVNLDKKSQKECESKINHPYHKNSLPIISPYATLYLKRQSLPLRASETLYKISRQA